MRAVVDLLPLIERVAAQHAVELLRQRKVPPRKEDAACAALPKRTLFAASVPIVIPMSLTTAPGGHQRGAAAGGKLSLRARLDSPASAPFAFSPRHPAAAKTV